MKVMTGTEDDFWAPRNCFLEPTEALHRAADLLDAAATAIIGGDNAQAERLIREADDPAVWEFASQIIGSANPNIHRFRECDGAPPFLRSADKRMPSKAEELAVFQRDGWRCRVCGVRVLYPKAVKKLRDLFPAAARWGRSNVDQHSALLVLKASLDHILPHSRGGDNDPLNLVTACYPCQFGRSSWTLEEVGLTDPRLRPPVVNHWDGLVRLMKS
jgi:5-methylcytosine-specific restriction endonuclease McrA